MLRLTCTADFSQLGDFNTVMGRVLNKTIQLIAQDYSDEVKRQIRKKHVIDTGNMKNSILINLIYRGAQVVSGVEYLPYQNDGTGIYGKYRTPIVPKQKKALVFTIAGKTFTVQDLYGLTPQKKWDLAIAPFIKKTPKTDGIIITFFSCGSLFYNPKRSAKYMNKKLSDVTLEKTKKYGWIIMDYPTEKFIKEIINSNF